MLHFAVVFFFKGFQAYYSQHTEADFTGCGRTIRRDKIRDDQVLPLVYLFVFICLYLFEWRSGFEDLDLSEMSFYKHPLKYKWRE